VLATIVLRTLVVDPGLLVMPLIELFEKVSLLRLAVAPVTFDRPSLVLPEMVLLISVRVPAFVIPPPPTEAVLPEMVLPLMVIVPPVALVTPPPWEEVILPVTAQAVSVNVP
jgi:hypothetical protein